MAHTYPSLRATLEGFVDYADDELAAIRDDQLHNLVNQTSRQAALALRRLDQLDEVANRR